MFAPKGYWPVSKLLGDSYGSLLDDAQRCIRERDNGFARLWLERPFDLVRRWVFGFCKQELFIYKVGSEPIRIDADVILFQHAYIDIVYRSLNTEQRREWSGIKIFSEQFKLCKPINDEHKNTYFDFIKELGSEADRGRKHDVDELGSSLLEHYIDDLGSTHPYLFIEMDTGSINLQLFDFLMNLKTINLDQLPDEESQRVSHALRPMEGYYLVTPETHVAENWAKFVGSAYSEQSNSDRLTFLDDPKQNAVKRGAKGYQRARAVYLDKKDQFSHLTQKEICEELYSLTGERPDPRTLRDWNEAEIKGNMRG